MLVRIGWIGANYIAPDPSTLIGEKGWIGANYVAPDPSTFVGEKGWIGANYVAPDPSTFVGEKGRIVANFVADQSINDMKISPIGATTPIGVTTPIGSTDLICRCHELQSFHLSAFPKDSPLYKILENDYKLQHKTTLPTLDNSYICPTGCNRSGYNHQNCAFCRQMLS